MEVGMVHEVLAPGVEDGGEAQLGLEALLAELEERGAGRLEEQLVEGGRVLQGQGAQGGRERENPVEIADGQECAALVFQPLPAALVLAGRAVAVAAAVGPPVRALAVRAVPDGPTQLGGATPGQAPEYFELVSRHRMTVEVFGQEYL
jgi:hypothetical protein